MITIHDCETLGRQIYEEQARLQEQSRVVIDEKDPINERLETLKLAAEFNGLALSALRRRS